MRPFLAADRTTRLVLPQYEGLEKEKKGKEKKKAAASNNACCSAKAPHTKMKIIDKGAYKVKRDE